MTAQPMCSMAAAIAGLNALLGVLNTGGAGHIRIYSGSAPATVETSPSGTLLSSGLALSNPAFPTATDGTTNGLATAVASSIASDTNATASGTAGYFRARNGAGTDVIQGTCGTSSADMIMNTTTITAGDTIAVTSWTVTLPDGSGAD